VPNHFLALTDFSSAQLKALISAAVELKAEWQNGGNRPLLTGQVLAMVFQKPSLRTRVSFEVGMRHLGGHALYLSPAEVGLGERESVPDVARVLSGMCQGIMARTFSHDHLLGLAQWASVPVINGLTDYNHPCQAMADVLTMQEHFGQVSGLKVAFIGDGNNVATSLAYAAGKFGFDFAIATPADYALPQPVWELAQHVAAEGGVTLTQTTDIAEAVRGAHVLYTDTWTSMGQEAESERRRRDFAGYQINDELLRLADPSAVVMHCLPAHRGEEITDEVADGPRSLLFQQAANRLHAQKAILVHCLAPSAIDGLGN
jgi:ornithine carbamoyltransferase